MLPAPALSPNPTQVFHSSTDPPGRPSGTLLPQPQFILLCEADDCEVAAAVAAVAVHSGYFIY